MKYLWSFMLFLILALQYRLWVGDGSFTEVWRLQASVDAQRLQNEQLHSRNRQLDAEVLDLKNGVQAIEERARSELGMIGPNETFFMMVGSHQ
ncbi:MAG: cell division protein FtsB [Oleiphilaceae bacterium]|nr:cell division protein FtsB [Oleiphilaceae bacterium]